MLPECAADRRCVDRLIEEAKVLLLCSHPNIVEAYDMAKAGENYIMTMEYIEGVNLGEEMDRCRERNVTVPPEIASFIASEICKGLDYIHNRCTQKGESLGIVHRNISPEHILISSRGEVKIAGFGKVKSVMNVAHVSPEFLEGNIAYMSPEQAMGKAVDRRTDIFSTGILIYEMLTGTKLFAGESQFEALKKLRTTKIGPEPLRPILVKALSHEPGERYQRAGDLQSDLYKYLADVFPEKDLDSVSHDLSDFMRSLSDKQHGV
jgi:serine/threonine protein kinase